MIHTKLNFKNTKACILAASILCCAVSGVYAQPYVQLPNYADSLWFTDANQVLGLNTAQIGCNGNPMDFIFAGAYYDGSGGESIYVNDFLHSLSQSQSSTSTLGSVPDVILGNYNHASSICTSCTSAQNDFIMATAFADATQQHVLIDFYRVYDDHSTTLTITPILTYTVSGTYSIQTVHMDVIAQSQNTTPTGNPFCDKFVVTWDDFSGGGSVPNVWTAYGSLNTGSAGTLQQMNPSGTYGYAPDVAAIQLLGSGPIDDVALVTYVDGATNNKLYYSEWDFTGSSFITPLTMLEDGTGGSYITGISVPRIDGNDNLTQNDPANSYSVYKVVAQVDSTIGGHTYPVVKTYDNVMYNAGGGTDFTPSDYIDLSAYPLSPYPAPTTSHAYYNYAPSVALGVPWTYRVQQIMNYNNTSGNDILFMEPVDIFYPEQVVNDSCYWINTGVGSTTPSHIQSADCSYANSVSGSANLQGLSFDVYAWGLYNSSGPDYEVHYKIPTAGSPFAFKPGGQPTAVTNAQAQGWQVYPNPAANVLTVNNGGVANAATEYQIMDMAGRELQKGGLQTITNIDVSLLVPGTYIIKRYNANGDSGNALFVKD